jgi:hypothetical protein
MLAGQKLRCPDHLIISLLLFSKIPIEKLTTQETKSKEKNKDLLKVSSIKNLVKTARSTICMAVSKIIRKLKSHLK